MAPLRRQGLKPTGRDERREARFTKARPDVTSNSSITDYLTRCENWFGLRKIKMSAYTKGKNYEQFVQNIYHATLLEEGYSNIVVELNKTDLVSLKGVTHQIDIYWEFEVAGNRYRTAIECKDHASPIPIGKIRDFNSVLMDYPGLYGIFVSTNGFQRGAVHFAEKSGITLKEIREPRDEDFDGRIKEIHLTSNVVTTNITRFELVPTKSFLATIPKDGQVALVFEGTNYDPMIFDKDGNPIASHADIQNSLPTDQTAEIGKKWRWQKTGAHFRTPEGALIPLEFVYFEYDVLVSSVTSISRAQDMVRGVIKDIQTGNLRFI